MNNKLSNTTEYLSKLDLDDEGTEASNATGNPGPESEQLEYTPPSFSGINRPFTIERIGSRGSLYLPTSIKLKAKENYLIWKEQIHNLAIANGLKRYIKVGAKIPIVVEEDDARKSTLAEIEAYEK